MRILSRVGLVCFLLQLVQAVSASEPKTLHWTIQGEKREAIIILPEGPRTKPAPLVFIFHGHGTTMENAAHRYDIKKHWPEAAAVYMQGLPTASRVDPKGKKAGWQTTAGTEGDRDLKFLDAVLKTIRKQHTIDEDRIYATGHSNGGGFTYLLYLTRHETFAAYAPSAAMLHLSEKITPQPAPVFHIAGETDQTAPFEMQNQTIKKVREINGCKLKPVDWGSDCKLYPPKTPSGAPFVCLIHPGGHGDPPNSFDLVIKFFKEHPRNHSKLSEEK